MNLSTQRVVGHNERQNTPHARGAGVTFVIVGPTTRWSERDTHGVLRQGRRGPEGSGVRADRSRTTRVHTK